MASAHRGAEAVAVFATVLALAACGSDVPEDPSLSVGPSLPTESRDTESGGSLDESEPTATPPTGETTAAQDIPEETGSDEATSTLPDFAAPGAPQTQDAMGQTQLIIEDVRVGTHDGFDRVVLDLSGTGEVGWRVQYVTDPALDGSGAPVDLAGQFVLRVDLQGMAYPEPGDTAYEDGELLVDGGDLTTVTEVLRTSPFEGQVPVFIGSGVEAPFRVFALSDPARLVIDLQH